jgi:hypothetical protein
MDAFPEAWVLISERWLGARDLVLLALEALMITLLLKATSRFGDELTAVDALVSEYVRCRDFLLASRRTGTGSSWPAADGAAFREAWLNFNRQLERIRERHSRSIRKLRVGLLALLVLLMLATAAGLPALLRQSAGGLSRLLGAGTAFLTGLFIWLLAWVQIGALAKLLLRRTKGDYLIAPWPSDGGASEKQLTVFQKFLPVEQTPASGPAPEVP